MLTINNTLDGFLKDVEIKGNTIQDIEQKGDLSDIRSVGDKVEGQELYEIPVLSVRKNLWNGVLKDGDIGNDTGLGRPVSGHAIPTDYVKCPSNTNIVISYTVVASSRWFAVYEYDKDKNYLGYTEARKFTTKPNTRYIKFKIENSANIDIKDLMIEVGTQSTPYEPYQGDKLTILSPVQLEKVGDVRDRIICKDGVWGVEKNVTEKLDLLKATWIRHVENDNNLVCKTSTYSDVVFKEYSDKIISNFTSSIPQAWNGQTVGISTFNDGWIYLCVPKTLVPTIDNLSTYLNNVGAYAICRNSQPQFIPLPQDQQVKLRTFANKTNISFLTEIEGTIKAQVPKSLGATVNTHTEQIGNLNKELDRVKKLEESTVSTVISDKSFTTVSETTQGYFEDVKIEGKTLVNLFNNTLKVGKSCLTIDKIKEDINYTIVVNTNNFTGQLNCQLSTDNINYTSDHEIVSPTKNNTSTVVKKLAKTGRGGLIVMNYGLYLLNHTQGDVSILILEGDHTQNPPSYFEGLMSVGQDVDKITVVSRNSNLLNLTELVLTMPNPSNVRIDYLDENNVKFTTLSTNTNKYASVYFDGFNFVPNVKYKFKCKVKYKDTTNTPFFSIRDHNNASIQYVGFDVKNGVIEGTFTPNHPDHRIEFFAGNHTGTLTNTWVEFTDIQLSMDGDNFNYHISPKKDKKELVYYNNETQTWEKPVLRQWDSIEKHSDGKYYYHKRSGEGVITGLELDIRINAELEKVTRYFIKTSFPNCKGQYSTQIFDKFKFDNNFVGDYTHAYADSDGNVMMFSEQKTLDSFKAWLQANPTTVVYKLAEEKVYECTNIDLITYDGETNYIVSSGAIAPKSTLKVHNNISNVVKILQEKVNLLESNVKASQEVQDMMILESDLRILDIELALMEHMPIKLNLANEGMLRSATYFNFIKGHIVNETYSKEYLENVMNKYLATNRLTQEEYDELYKMLYPQNYDIELPIEE